MTQKCKKYKNLFFILSLVSWLGQAGFLVIYGVCTGFKETDGSQVSTIGAQLLDIFMPLAITYVIALLLIIFIREKARNTVWIANIVMNAALFGTSLMYMSIGLFALDEFVFMPLYKHFKNRYQINKEIDRR